MIPSTILILMPPSSVPTGWPSALQWVASFQEDEAAIQRSTSKGEYPPGTTIFAYGVIVFIFFLAVQIFMFINAATAVPMRDEICNEVVDLLIVLPFGTRSQNLGFTDLEAQTNPKGLCILWVVWAE